MTRRRHVYLHLVARELGPERLTVEPPAGHCIVDVSDAAVLANVSTRTIMRWVASGRLVPVGHRGRAHLFRGDDVLEAAA